MIFPFKRKKTPQATKPASVPDGLRIYAIGDIHGRLDLLDRLHAMILNHAAADPANEYLLVYLGDYIDRGPQSAEVLERLSGGALGGWPRVTLRGNHEEMLLQFLSDPSAGANWRQLGGLETLLSYRVPVREIMQSQGFAGLAARTGHIIPDQHIDFLKRLQLSFTVGDYFFCHAGIRPGVALAEQTPRDLLWIRDDFLSSDADHGCVVVHGHSPVDAADLRLNRINIDTGAYATNRLTCLVLEASRQQLIST